MKTGVLLDEEHRLEVTPESAERRRFVYLPVDVPAFAAELRVRYEVSGSARIDIGAFEPSDGDPPRIEEFRGWSGSARNEFMIARDWATPGYIPGPITSGRWCIILGLYVVNEPVEITVRVQVSRRASKAARRLLPTEHEVEAARTAVRDAPGMPLRQSVNPLSEAGWTRGDLHCHTNHSNDADQPMTVAEAVGAAELLGLDFLAITDHNTVSHWNEMRALEEQSSVTLVRAVEVTTYGGHFNAFLPEGIVDFRTDDGDKIEEIIARAVHGGAVISVNHPKRVGPPWEYPIPAAATAIEAWQAPWFWMNWESMGLWTSLLDEGWRITGVGGSDIHDLHARPGHTMATPTTWIRPTGEGVDGLLGGLRQGKCMITESPDSPVLRLEVSHGDNDWVDAPGETARPGRNLRVQVIGDAKGLDLCTRWSRSNCSWTSLEEGDACVDVGSVDSEMKWLRAELWDLGPERDQDPSRRLVAVTNPVFVGRPH